MDFKEDPAHSAATISSYIIISPSATHMPLKPGIPTARARHRTMKAEDFLASPENKVISGGWRMGSHQPFQCKVQCNDESMGLSNIDHVPGQLIIEYDQRQ